LQGQQSFDAKDGVVEVTSATAIAEATVGILLTSVEVLDERGGISQEFRRQPRHLQHLQSDAHCG